MICFGRLSSSTTSSIWQPERTCPHAIACLRPKLQHFRQFRAQNRQQPKRARRRILVCPVRRVSQTRDNSQRQLPTDHDYAVPTREYQTDQSSLKPAQTAALCPREKERQNTKTTPPKQVTRSLHIRARGIPGRLSARKQPSIFSVEDPGDLAKIGVAEGPPVTGP
jgi:hypothetical protein